MNVDDRPDIPVYVELSVQYSSLFDGRRLPELVLVIDLDEKGVTVEPVPPRPYSHGAPLPRFFIPWGAAVFSWSTSE